MHYIPSQITDCDMNSLKYDVIHWLFLSASELVTTVTGFNQFVLGTHSIWFCESIHL